MTFQTTSGIFVREEASLGLLTYSPFSGLFYACDKSDKDRLLMWLDKEIPVPPAEVYAKALGAGWFIEPQDAEYPIPHMLPPQSEEWGKAILCSQKPILINWLITGGCPLNCKYCYAQDLMNGKYREPSLAEIKDIANSILEFEPLVVVLTGGDPLVSPHLGEAIELLHGKVGIIIDTSAYSLNQDHIDLFKEYNVFVRISLDSEIPKINDSLRPALVNSKRVNRPFSNNVEVAVNGILKCIDHNIRIAVQSVATNKNRSDFMVLGDKLFKLGVSGWRILMIAPSSTNFEAYLKLSGDEISQRRFYKYILKKLKTKHTNDWERKMSVQVAGNRVPNAVILVAPDGTFLTESQLKGQEVIGKVLIDQEFPNQPRIARMLNSINMHAHTERYLNLES